MTTSVSRRIGKIEQRRGDSLSISSALVATAISAATLASTSLATENSTFETLAAVLVIGSSVALAIHLLQDRAVRRPTLREARLPTVLGLVLINAMTIGTPGATLRSIGSFLLAVAVGIAIGPQVARNTKLRTVTVKTFVASSALVATTAIMGVLGVSSLGPLPFRTKSFYEQFAGFAASGGIMEHPATAGVHIAFGLVLSSVLIRTKQWPRVMTALVALQLAGLLATQSRAGILGLGCAALASLNMRRDGKARNASTAVAAVLLVILVWAAATRIGYVQSFLRLDRGTMGRSGAWDFAIERIPDEPIFGHGAGSAAEVTLASAAELHDSGFRAAGASFHNTTINALYEYGIPLTAMYVFAYVEPSIRALRRRLMTPEFTWLAIAAFVSSMAKAINLGGVRSISLITTIAVASVASELSRPTSATAETEV